MQAAENPIVVYQPNGTFWALACGECPKADTFEFACAFRYGCIT